MSVACSTFVGFHIVLNVYIAYFLSNSHKSSKYEPLETYNLLFKALPMMSTIEVGSRAHGLETHKELQTEILVYTTIV